MVTGSVVDAGPPMPTAPFSLSTVVGWFCTNHIRTPLVEMWPKMPCLRSAGKVGT